MGPTDRVVVLIDMDCFYCQVEERLDPKLEGQPIAVVQYNAWRGGGIIAVNYPARDQGVTRHMRGNDAKKVCPNIKLVQVAELRGKADLTKYREAGKRVADVLATFTPLLQRASVDEAYLDITESVNTRIQTGLSDLKLENVQNTFVVGTDTEDFIHNVTVNSDFCESDLKLAVGALITEEIRCEVYNKTGYKCSAGIAHNKTLAKLVCSLHKPNKQTVLPQSAIPQFFEKTAVTKIKSLGGKFGQTLSADLGITFMGQLAKFTEKELLQKYEEKTANWLYNIARGIDLEPVTTKLIPKSIGCCKNFPGKTALFSAESIEHWLSELATEISERLEKDVKENNRRAKQIVVSFTQEIDKKDIHRSRTNPLVSYESKKIAQGAFEVIKKNCLKSDGSYHVKFLGISASNFENAKKIREITSFFKRQQTKMVQQNKEDISNLQNSSKIINDSFNEEMDENIYLLSTPEPEEDESNLCFYDDKYMIKKETDNLVPSSSNQFEELFNKPRCRKEAPVIPCNQKTLPSFFENYFENGQPYPSKNKSCISNQENESDNFVNVKLCPDCHKNIPIDEFIFHQDYHFALKLDKDERESELRCQKQTSNVSKTTNKTTARGKKRKSNESNSKSNTLLSTFLKKDDVSDSTGCEVCSQCKKKIKIEEMTSHMDYHTAKKLHLEINSFKPATKNSNQSLEQFLNKN